jgi:hypothetical protein
MDYRRFLNKSDERVLPYFGGPFVDAEDRRLRVSPAFEPHGWYRFKVEGRVATRLGPADPTDLAALPKVIGWFHDGALVRDGAVAETLGLIPAEQPARFAKIAARRWRSGELLFGELEFESEVEGQVREALAEGRSLKAVKAVPAPLRAAFAYALMEEASRRTGLRFAPGEVRGKVLAIADGGPAEAEKVLRGLEAERALARREMEELHRRQAEAAARGEVQREREARIAHARQNRERSEARAEAALEAAGARLEQARELGNGRLEVIFRFMDHRFISVVELGTLQVIDSGICLGHPPSDKLVTLESLPAVIKEAIDTHALVILRFP